MKKIAYVGIDYHMNVVAIAVIIEGEKDFYDTIRLKNTDKLVGQYLQKLSPHFTIKACYEASSSGYCFQKQFDSPSKQPPASFAFYINRMPLYICLS